MTLLQILITSQGYAEDYTVVKSYSNLIRTTVYKTSSGKKIIKINGSKSWRNNNPGNLRSNGNSKAYEGVVGSSGGFLIFSDVELGRKALVACVSEKYGNVSLKVMIYQYAPPSENITKNYLSFLQKRTKVYSNKKISTFSETEFEALIKGIETMEGWKVGRVVERG
jgi:hypothetical protein